MRHVAFFYGTDAEYTSVVGDALAETVRKEQPVLLAVSPGRAEALSGGLDSTGVESVDVTTVGRNPSRLIPAVQGFFDAHAGGKEALVVCEPFWGGRSREENAEVVRHEALVNRAFGDTEATIICPYRGDTPTGLLDDARRTHPLIRHDGDPPVPSPSFTDPDRIWHSAEQLPRPPQARTQTMDFDARGLSAVREIVRAHALAARLSGRRVDDLVGAVSELAANSIRHGRGTGSLRVWAQGDAVYCEVRDRGQLQDPLAGRRKPATAAGGGWGLWLVNQLCDLVQLRAGDDGVTVRVRVDR
jgi:anti-sigma regulatory factor (Ser/Thr protein kinase)